MMNNIEIIKRNSYKKKNKKHTIHEALNTAKEKQALKTNQNREWENLKQDRGIDLREAGHADFAKHHYGAHYTNSPH